MLLRSVTMARDVTTGTEVARCPSHTEDLMLLPLPANDPDPAAFDDPTELRPERAKNRHRTSGAGIHRCVESKLARLELSVALQGGLRALPDYRLDPEREAKWAPGQIRGPR